MWNLNNPTKLWIAIIFFDKIKIKNKQKNTTDVNGSIWINHVTQKRRICIRIWQLAVNTSPNAAANIHTLIYVITSRDAGQLKQIETPNNRSIIFVRRWRKIITDDKDNTPLNPCPPSICIRLVYWMISMLIPTERSGESHNYSLYWR